MPTAQKVLLQRATVSSPVNTVNDLSEYQSRELAPADAGLSPEGHIWSLRKRHPQKVALASPALPSAHPKRSSGLTTAHQPGWRCRLSLCPVREQRDPNPRRRSFPVAPPTTPTDRRARCRPWEDRMTQDSPEERAVVAALIEELVEALEQPTSHAAPQRTPQLHRRFCGRLLHSSHASHARHGVGVF